MNPVLLKPGTDRRSHVVLLGRPHGELVAGEFATGRRHLAEAAYAALADLRAPLRRGRLRGRRQPDRDQPARRATTSTWAWPGAPGCRSWSSATSTAAACSPPCTARSPCSTPPTRRWSRGWIVNKFRGDPALLQPRPRHDRGGDRPAGARRAALAGRRVAGLRGRARRRRLVRAPAAAPAAHAAGGGRPAAPRLSNATDVDALAAEPGVAVDRDRRPGRGRRRRPGRAARHPGHRGRPGLAARARHRRRRAWPAPPPAGRCSASAAATRCSPSTSTTRSSPAPARCAGLGLLPTDRDVRRADKRLGRPAGSWRGHPVRGVRDPPRRRPGRRGTPPARPGAVPRRLAPRRGLGHHLARRLRERRLPPGLAHRRRRRRPASTGGPRPARPVRGRTATAMLDRLADAVDEHLDTARCSASSRTAPSGPAVHPTRRPATRQVG